MLADVHDLDAIDFAALDIDAYLDMRDSPPFDTLWRQADAAVAEAKAGLSAAVLARLEEDSKAAREQAFRRVYQATQESDLAAYIADDFGLLTEAWLLGVTEPPFLQHLAESYVAGRLPEVPDDQAALSTI